MMTVWLRRKRVVEEERIKRQLNFQILICVSTVTVTLSQKTLIQQVSRGVQKAI